MKKTKILVPALAILALGMAASVTGTVAWFSTNTVVYADGISLQSQAADSLLISTDHANWGSSVTHALTQQSLMPAYLTNTLTGESFPKTGNSDASFLTLDTTKLEGESAQWYVDSDGKVKKSSDHTVVSPTNADPFTAAEAKVNAARIQAVEYLKLSGSSANKQVKLHIKAGRETAGKEIDKALRFAFWDSTNLTVVQPFTSVETASDYEADITQTFSVSTEYKEVHFYAWYDGEAPECKNLNAISNLVTIHLTYSLVQA